VKDVNRPPIKISGQNIWLITLRRSLSGFFSGGCQAAPAGEGRGGRARRHEGKTNSSHGGGGPNDWAGVATATSRLCLDFLSIPLTRSSPKLPPTMSEGGRKTSERPRISNVGNIGPSATFCCNQTSYGATWWCSQRPSLNSLFSQNSESLRLALKKERNFPLGFTFRHRKRSRRV